VNGFSAGTCAAALVIAIAVGSPPAIDLQGHRGARGLAPENTLAGFRRALAIGVTTLESDLALTRDGVLVLSHELVRAAGCSIWSPFWRNVTAELVAEAHTLGPAVVPWTVNDVAEIVRLAGLKVDSIITDYPDRARHALEALGVAID
jgi:glycerophosphoryl diester phosphodiesterase